MDNTITWCPNVDKFRDEKRKVFKAIEGLEVSDAVYVLEQTREHIYRNSFQNDTCGQTVSATSVESYKPKRHHRQTNLTVKDSLIVQNQRRNHEYIFSR